MAAAKKKDDDKKLGSKKERSGSDELAIMAEIVLDTPHLKDRVLARLKEAAARAGRTEGGAVRPAGASKS